MQDLPAYRLIVGQTFSFTPDTVLGCRVTDIDLFDNSGDHLFLYTDISHAGLHGHLADFTSVWVDDSGA